MRLGYPMFKLPVVERTKYVMITSKNDLALLFFVVSSFDEPGNALVRGGDSASLQ